MKTKYYSKAYGYIGKILCAGAGGIVGYVTGGALFLLVGIGLGFSAGYLLEKLTLKASLRG